MTAKAVGSVEEILLQDGKKATLKPLTIKKLREFGPMLKDFVALEDQEEDVYLEHLVQMAAFCISKQHPQYLEDEDARDEAFDIDTVYYVIEACTGTDLKPNPEAIKLLMEQQAKMNEEPGKTSKN